MESTIMKCSNCLTPKDKCMHGMLMKNVFTRRKYILFGKKITTTEYICMDCDFKYG